MFLESQWHLPILLTRKGAQSHPCCEPPTTQATDIGTRPILTPVAKAQAIFEWNRQAAALPYWERTWPSTSQAEPKHAALTTPSPAPASLRCKHSSPSPCHRLSCLLRQRPPWPARLWAGCPPKQLQLPWAKWIHWELPQQSRNSPREIQVLT